MKKKILLSLFGVVALAGCSDESGSQVNENSGEHTRMLSKTTTYFPSVEDYSSRNVRYYENNLIVADSTYDSAGNFLSKNDNVRNGNLYTIITVSSSGQVAGTVTMQYDSQGRLVDYNDNNILRMQYTYLENTIVAKQWKEASATYSRVSEFTIGSNGYIESQKYFEGQQEVMTQTLLFDGSKPTALYTQSAGGAESLTMEYSYFANPVPTNMQWTAIQANNEVLRLNQLHVLPQFAKYYLQSYTVSGDAFYDAAFVFSPVTGYTGYPEKRMVMQGGMPYNETFFRYAE